MRLFALALAVFLPASMLACDAGSSTATVGTSAEGESCAATSDCVHDLRCVDLRCVDLDAPGDAAGLDTPQDVTEGHDVAVGSDVTEDVVEDVDTPQDVAEGPDATQDVTADIYVPQDTGPPPVCDVDGWCNLAGCGAGVDPDCGPSVVGVATEPSYGWNGCDCDGWAGACEAISHCSQAICLCDTDCTLQGGGLWVACDADGLCDKLCPVQYDPDCDGLPGDGLYCGAPSCNKTSGHCNAEIGTTEPCADDPDCIEGAVPCLADGYCDSACGVGVDPDC